MTIELYTRKSSKQRIIPVAITVLYLGSVVEGVLQWAEINLLIQTSEQLETAIGGATLSAITNNPILVDATGYIPQLVADGLLVSYV